MLLACCFRTPVSNPLDRKEIFSQPPSPTHAHSLRQPTQTLNTASREPGAETWASGEWGQRKIPGNVDLPWLRPPSTLPH